MELEEEEEERVIMRRVGGVASSRWRGGGSNAGQDKTELRCTLQDSDVAVWLSQVS